MQAAVVLVEDFNYTAGAELEGLGTSNVWTLSTNANNQQTASVPLKVSDTGLSMAYYGQGAEASGLGVVIPQCTISPESNRQRVTYKMFDTNSSYKPSNTDALYVAFLINVSEATSNTRDFFAFDGNTGTAQRGRLFLKKSGAGYTLGITRANTTPVWSEVLELGKTYLAVMKYDFIDGDVNDEVSLFVNFPLGYDEYAGAVQAKMVKSTDFDSNTADPSQLKAMSVKQREGGGVLIMSHLRVTTTWEEAVNYTGPSIEPEDPNKPVFHFQEGFDTNGNWTVIRGGSSTNRNHGDFGTTDRSLTFNKTEGNDRCNHSQIISPAVNTAGVLRFFVIGSANETRGNITVYKIIGSDTTEVAYIEGPFNKEWREVTVLVRDERANIKVMLEVNDCGLGAGTLYIDDISLTNYISGQSPEISGATLTVPFPSVNRPTAVRAAISSPEERSIAEAKIQYGYHPEMLDEEVAMRKTDATQFLSDAIKADRTGKVYYRIIAFDAYYVSDTTEVMSYTVYQSYATRLTPNVTLAAGEEWTYSEGLEGLRAEFAGTGAMELSVIAGEGTPAVFTGTETATTGDIRISVEPGVVLRLRNTGTSALTLNAVEFDEFRPVVFNKQPQRMQLYPRNSENKAVVEIAGMTQHSGINQVTLKMYRNKEEQSSKPLSVSKGVPFAASFEITAEPADYKFTYTTNMGTEEVLADSVVAGDVFVIAGQSNGAAAASGNPGVTNLYWRNFGCVQKTSVYNPADTTWGMSNSAGWGYGKQYYNGWSGYVMQRNLLQEQNMPTAVVNIAIGGSSLNQNMPNEENHEDLSTFYGEGLYRLRKAGLADAVKAIIWVQGESDQNGLYEDYALRFDKLYHAWKQDYPNVERIYLSQINVGCGTSPYASEMREMQRMFGQIYDDITVITNIGITIRYDSCHYVDDGYDRLYTQYTRLIERDFYGKTFDRPLTSPAVKSVQWTDEQKNTIAIRFDQEMVWPEIMWGRDMKDYFYDENEQAIPMKSGKVDTADKHIVLLELESSAARPTHLTYGPDNYVYSATRGMDTLYVDPWLRNEDGYAALTFNRYPIADHSVSAYENISGKGFCRVEGEELIADSPAGVDSIIVYTVLGQTVLQVKGDRCSMAALPRGIYSVRINLRNGEGLSTKIRK